MSTNTSFAAEEAAAGLATALLLARCQSGAEIVLPQTRWLAAASDDLLSWMQEGGFHPHPAARGPVPRASGSCR